MYYKCCVENWSSKRPQVKLHQLPTSEKGLHKWLVCLNSDRLHNLSPRKLKNEFVCHKHFESRFVKDNGRILLEGYPSLFSQEKFESGVPSATLEAKLVGTLGHSDMYHVEESIALFYLCTYLPIQSRVGTDDVMMTSALRRMALRAPWRD